MTEGQEGSSIYQDPVLLVFGQNNGRYPAENSLERTQEVKHLTASTHITTRHVEFSLMRKSLAAYQQARHDGDDVRDGVLHGPGLRVHVDVSEHGAVHQRSQEEVHVSHHHQPQPHLHQGLVVLEVGRAYSCRCVNLFISVHRDGHNMSKMGTLG